MLNYNILTYTDTVYINEQLILILLRLKILFRLLLFIKLTEILQKLVLNFYSFLQIIAVEMISLKTETHSFECIMSPKEVNLLMILKIFFTCL